MIFIVFLAIICCANAFKFHPFRCGQYSLSVRTKSRSLLSLTNSPTIQSNWAQNLLLMKRSDVFTTLSTLSNSGLTYSELSANQINSIVETVSYHLSHIDANTLSGLFQSLGRLGWNNKDFPDLTNVMLLMLSNQLPHMRIERLSDAMEGLHRIGLKKSDLFAQLESILFECIDKRCQYVNNDNSGKGLKPTEGVMSAVTSIVASLGAMGAEWSEVPRAVKSGLFECITSVDVLSGSQLSHLLRGLIDLKVDWLRVDKATRQLVVNSLKKGKVEQLSDLLSVLTSLASFKVTLDYADKIVNSHTAQSDSSEVDPIHCWLTHINKFEGSLTTDQIVVLFDSLVHLETSWTSLSADVRECFLRILNTTMSYWDCPTFASVTRNLAIMLHDFSLADSASPSEQLLLNVLQSSLLVYDEIKDFMTRSDMNKAMVYLLLLKRFNINTDNHIAVLVDLFKNNKDGTFDFDDAKFVKLNRNFVQQIRSDVKKVNANFKVVETFCGLKFDGLPVDCAVLNSSDTRVTALIEIDGPHHFVNRTTLIEGREVISKLRRCDALKQVLYELHQPHSPFLRVDSDLARGTKKTAIQGLIAAFCPTVKPVATAVKPSAVSKVNSSSAVSNSKSKLLELLQKNKLPTDKVFSTVAVSQGGFQSSVTIEKVFGDSSRVFVGEVCGSKKEAERSAADVVLRDEASMKLLSSR